MKIVSILYIGVNFWVVQWGIKVTRTDAAYWCFVRLSAAQIG